LLAFAVVAPRHVFSTTQFQERASFSQPNSRSKRPLNFVFRCFQTNFS
jgi:hypothetical protein